jgi:photoactive yellow protein
MIAQKAPTSVATFDNISIAELESLSPGDLDQFPFGVVGMAPTGDTEVFNTMESRLSGLRPDQALGKPFFTEVARCMNNRHVAHRFDEEPELDVTIDYVLALRMEFIPVRLRMLRSGSVRRRYLLVQR